MMAQTTLLKCPNCQVVVFPDRGFTISPCNAHSTAAKVSLDQLQWQQAQSQAQYQQFCRQQAQKLQAQIWQTQHGRAQRVQAHPEQVQHGQAHPKQATLRQQVPIIPPQHCLQPLPNPPNQPRSLSLSLYPTRPTTIPPYQRHQPQDQQHRYANSFPPTTETPLASPSSLTPSTSLPVGRKPLDTTVARLGPPATVQHLPNSPAQVPLSLLSRQVVTPPDTPQSDAARKSQTPGFDDKRLYCYTSGFLLAPQPIRLRPCTQTHNFTLSAEDLQVKPMVPTANKIYLLRCAPIDSDSVSTVTQDMWSTRDSVWPPHVFIYVNDRRLAAPGINDVKHASPLVISPLLCIGQNNVRIMINRPSTDKSSQVFAFALEVVVWRNISEIIQIMKGNKIPAEAVCQSIAASLAGQASPISPSDELIATTDHHVTIGLFEPFTNAKPCNFPVRGRNCKHREAFDVLIFLETRPLPKPGNPEWYKNNYWRCPICNGDARPSSLVFDMFLKGVQSRLRDCGLSQSVREITVDRNGNWAVKKDTADSVVTSPAQSHAEIHDSSSSNLLPKAAALTVRKRSAESTPEMASDKRRHIGPKIIDLTED